MFGSAPGGTKLTAVFVGDTFRAQLLHSVGVLRDIAEGTGVRSVLPFSHKVSGVLQAWQAPLLL